MEPLNQQSLLSRWSRRKQQSTLDPQLEDQLIDSQQQNTSPAESENTQNIEQQEPLVVLTDEDMPPLSSLNEESDFSGFMSSGVSDELRNLALRKLFNIPSFNLRDGLDEYDEDYTSFEKLGDIVTCDMKHQVEMEARKKLEEEARKLSESDIEESNETAASEQIDFQQNDEKFLQEPGPLNQQATEQPVENLVQNPSKEYGKK